MNRKPHSHHSKNSNNKNMIEDSNQATNNVQQENAESNFLSIQFFVKSFLLNWQWILLSVFICLGLAVVYLRYTPAVYQITAKILIKEDDRNMMRNSNKIQAAANLGFVTNSDGFDNELEVLKSVSIAEGAVRDLKLYVSYESEGRIKDRAIYKETPVIVDVDRAHLDTISGKIYLDITKEGNIYNVEGGYYMEGIKEPVEFTASGALPMSIPTKAGIVSIAENKETKRKWKEGRSIKANIYNPAEVAEMYAKSMSVEALSKTTTIADIIHNDIIPERGIDYLKQVAVVYNRLANIDKNEIAVRTELFINERLEKINKELGSTDGAIENFKRVNNMVDIQTTAQQVIENTNEAEKEITEMGKQLLLMESIKEYVDMPSNKYQTLPSNVGLTDPAATTLISQFNTIVLERNRLLGSASELSPTVVALTAQLDDLTNSLKRALSQAIKNVKIQRDVLQNSYNKYSSKLANSPEQERFLTEIGRQQEVKSSLYIMLLQKREENSISLAATADKGKLIDKPLFEGKVRPRISVVMLIAFILGLAIPFCILILQEMLRFRIEGHEDVAKLTTRPIIADVAVANESAKTKGEIVVRENKNDQMEEIFRGMRTNLQFLMKGKQNVIMFTSTVSGEGKTFVAANLSVSFALLGKKVLLVGLDIRRPRLAALFELDSDEDAGISTLLTKESLTLEDIKSQIVPSGVNKNLDILKAGPIPPNPAELVSRTSLETIFGHLREEYDYVIVDTAPVGLVSDTLQIGRIADITVAVCRADYTEKSAFIELDALANNDKLPNMCVVINGIDMSKRKYGYAYGYGRYGKYGKYGKYNSHYGPGAGYGYHSYGYSSYHTSHYGNPNDDSIKL